MNQQEKIKKIKRLRLKPEELFLYHLFNKLDLFQIDDKPNKIYYLHNDEIFCEYKKKQNVIYFSYNILWFPLTKKYKFNISKIRSLLSPIIYQTLNIKNPKIYRIDGISYNQEWRIINQSIKNNIKLGY